MIQKEQKLKKNTKRILDLVSDLQLDRKMLKDKTRQKMRQTKQAEIQMFLEREQKEEAQKELECVKAELKAAKLRLLALEGIK